MKNGDTVVLDKGFNNSSEVKLIELRKYFSTVSDGEWTWETMTSRLSEKQMQIFIICPVRMATPEWRKRLEDHTESLEKAGYKVHLPHRDTDQTAGAYQICAQNMSAIAAAHEVHIFYMPESQGIHFDLGVAFALGKTIKVIETAELTVGKSFQNMIDHWQKSQHENSVFGSSNG